MMAKSKQPGRVTRMSTVNKKKTSPETTEERGPLWNIGWGLTGVSMLWSLYSIQDLMFPGSHIGREMYEIYWPGLIVGLAVEAFWGVVQYLNHKNVVIGHHYVVPVLNWVSMISVMGLLFWHGADRGNVALAVAGPIVPLVAKICWMGWDYLTKDPSGLTEEQQLRIHENDRESKYDAALAESEQEAERREHRAKLKRIEMEGELAIKQSDVDFKVEQDRQAKIAQLQRISPLSGQIIPGHVERSVPAPLARPAIPASKARPNEITVDIVDLTPAQRQNKALAATYHMAARNSPDGEINGRQFAEAQGISPGQLSKILKRFPESEFTEEELSQLGS